MKELVAKDEVSQQQYDAAVAAAEAANAAVESATRGHRRGHAGGLGRREPARPGDRAR